MKNEMKTAMVIGATGSFGGGVTSELLGRGWKVRALVRDVAAAKEALGAREGLELVAGDALIADDVARAARGADVIVDSFNVAYDKWDPMTIDSAKIVAEVAADQELLVLFPGNVYGLGPDFCEPLAEDAPREPHTKKGKIRNRIEAIFEEASTRGARFIVLRCGDFFGPGVPADSSWFNIVVEKAISGGAIVYPGDFDTPHQWAYMPDAAETAVDLIERADKFSAFEVFHFGGHVVEPRRLVEAIRKVLGDPDRKLKAFSWWMVTLASPFVGFLRELREMRYLWDEPVIMRDDKLRGVFEEVPHTPLDEAVAQTLEAMGAAKPVPQARPGRADDVRV